MSIARYLANGAPLTYIAGPYSGPSREKIEANIYRALDAGVQVAALGGMPIIPHTNTGDEEFEQVQPYTFWCKGYIKLLRVCHCVVMLHGWRESKGSIRELAEAIKLDLPVYYVGADNNVTEASADEEDIVKYDADADEAELAAVNAKLEAEADAAAEAEAELEELERHVAELEEQSAGVSTHDGAIKDTGFDQALLESLLD